MKRLKTKLLAALLLPAMTGLFAAPAIAGDDFKQGVKLMGEKRYEEATLLLKKAVRDEPNNVNALYYLALCWQYRGRTSDAMVSYQAILKKFPGTDAANRALQAIQGMSLPPGTTDAQWYGKPAAKSATETPQSRVRTYSGNSRSPVQNHIGSLIPEQATLYFEKGDAGLKVDAFINNRPIKLAFDTGATGIVVGKNQLEEIGIKPPDGDPVGQSGGSANDGSQSYWMMPADIKVGTIFREKFPIKVLSYNSSSPLLGQSFIQDFDYTIDRNAGIIRLVRKSSSHSSSSPAQKSSVNSGYAVPFNWEGPKMVVNVEVNGRPYPMIFDTGNSASAISFGAQDVKALNLNTEDGVGVTTSGVTGSGGGVKFKVKRIKLGPIEKFDVAVIANYAALGKPIVGQELYEGYEYTIDNDKKLIHFIRR